MKPRPPVSRRPFQVVRKRKIVHKSGPFGRPAPRPDRSAGDQSALVLYGQA